MDSKIIKNVVNYVNNLIFPLEKHYYHQYTHSQEVMERALYIWEKEWLNNEDLEILVIASLFHDTGFIVQYDNNEIIWAKIAKNFLKSILYPDEKIKKVEDIIIATMIDYKEPKNILEKIIKDADLDYLWRESLYFYEKLNNLKKELEDIKNIKISDLESKKWTISFLQNHKYYTKTQKDERDKQKIKNLKNLLHEIDSE